MSEPENSILAQNKEQGEQQNTDQEPSQAVPSQGLEETPPVAGSPTAAAAEQEKAESPAPAAQTQPEPAPAQQTEQQPSETQPQAQVEAPAPSVAESSAEPVPAAAEPAPSVAPPVQTQPEPAPAEEKAPAAAPVVPASSLAAKDAGSDAEKKTEKDSASPETPTPEAAAPAEGENFDQLVDSYSQPFSKPGTGGLITGHVVNITDTEVIVDIGYKSEGVISSGEFRDSEGNMQVKVGDQVHVLMESSEERDGYVPLSFAKARKLSVWNDIESAFQNETIITAKVLEKTKGGLSVDVGIPAFLPGSQVDVRPVRNLDALVGTDIQCRIIKVNRKRGNVVVSRKAILEEEGKAQKEETLRLLQEGSVLKGTVKNLTDYGAFVELGGIDGLLHITDMSWGRITHPSEVVSVSQEIDVKVLKFDPEKERVSLGIKQLTEDPWLHVEEKYPAAGKVRGKVLNVTDYGAFVELESGVEGLVHISEMSWSKRMRHPSKIVSTGQEVEAVVLEVNQGDRRISLGLKHAMPNPWESLADRYGVGTHIEGKVRNLTDFGAFVEIEEGIDGLVHISDLSWTQRVKHPSEMLKRGQVVKAVVLSLDAENRRLSLGIKQLEPDAWETYCSNQQAGGMVSGKMVRKTAFGVFVELTEGVEGLCRISELYPDLDDRKTIPFEVGEVHEFRILKMSPADHKIGLSMRPEQEPRKAVQAGKPGKAGKQPRQQSSSPVQQSSSGSSTGATLQEMMAMKEKDRESSRK